MSEQMEKETGKSWAKQIMKIFFISHSGTIVWHWIDYLIEFHMNNRLVNKPGKHLWIPREKKKTPQGSKGKEVSKTQFTWTLFDISKQYLTFEHPEKKWRDAQIGQASNWSWQINSTNTSGLGYWLCSAFTVSQAKDLACCKSTASEGEFGYMQP